MKLETSTITGVEVDRIRRDLPMLTRSIPAKPLLYLDNADSSVKLRSVLDRDRYFFAFEYANASNENRLSQNATKAVQDVRSSIANLLGASSPEEIVPGDVRAAFVFYNTEDECDVSAKGSVGCRSARP